MPHSTMPIAQWRAQIFLILQCCSALLLISWLLPSTRMIWTTIDIQLYQLLNGSLGHVYLWDVLWAFLSTRIADLLAGAVMLCAFMYSGFIFQQSQLRRALTVFVSLLIVTIIIRTLFTKLIGYYDLQHASPSVQLEGGFQLSAAFVWMEQFLEIKDRSSRSFPGDHASILLLWIAFLSVFTKGKLRLLVCAVGVFFILPRLVAGAHWLSDNLVGGGFIVLQTMAWGYYTALGKGVYRLLDRLAQPAFALLTHIPVLNKLSIARPLESHQG